MWFICYRYVGECQSSRESPGLCGLFVIGLSASVRARESPGLCGLFVIGMSASVRALENHPAYVVYLL